LRRRLRILWLRAQRARVGRELFHAEAELGWLGWEQVEFYDDEVQAQVAKIQEFESTQASLQNTTAELSGQKGALAEQLARETSAHDQAEAALAAEREPIASRQAEAEAAHRLKSEAIGRFDRAVEEIDGLEQRLEAQSREYMRVENPTMAIRAEARAVSDEIGRIGLERKLVLADKARVVSEVAALEAEMGRIEADLQRIDEAAAAARETLEASTRRVGEETRQLESETQKSNLQTAHLDREKQKPYRFIGACLADHGIFPRNQPQVLEKVFTLRERDFQLAETIASLRAECARVKPGILIVFYLLVLAVLFVLWAVIFHAR